MHYTSLENIHKVIDPLFLDGLEADFNKIKESKSTHRTKKLIAFQENLGKLKFLDATRSVLIQIHEGCSKPEAA